MNQQTEILTNIHQQMNASETEFQACHQGLQQLNQTLTMQAELINLMMTQLIALENPLLCFGIYGTEIEVCSSHGVCVDRNTCDCDLEWTGEQCEHQRYLWMELETVDTPAQRKGQGSVVYGDSMLVFGGRLTHGGAFGNDFWRLGFADLSWDAIEGNNSGPEGRFLASPLVYFDSIFFFGGFGGNPEKSYEDLWQFNFTQWMWHNYETSTDPKPDVRNGQSVIIYGDSLWMFAGLSPQGRQNDFWELKISSFIWNDMGTNNVPIRNLHPSVVYQDAMFVFGGHGQSDPLNDLWQFNFTQSMWHQIHPVTPLPGARFSHSSVVYNDAMFIFGGSITNGETCLNDVWKFDFSKVAWNEITTIGVPPMEREAHSAVVHDGMMYIFAGRYSQQGIYGRNDLWKLTL